MTSSASSDMTTRIHGWFVILGWDLLCSTDIPNLKSPQLLTTNVWKATQNVEIVVV